MKFKDGFRFTFFCIQFQVLVLGCSAIVVVVVGNSTLGRGHLTLVKGGTERHLGTRCRKLVRRHRITYTKRSPTELVFGLIKAKLSTLSIQQLLCE